MFPVLIQICDKFNDDRCWVVKTPEELPTNQAFKIVKTNFKKLKKILRFELKPGQDFYLEEFGFEKFVGVAVNDDKHCCYFYPKDYFNNHIKQLDVAYVWIDE